MKREIKFYKHYFNDFYLAQDEKVRVKFYKFCIGYNRWIGCHLPF